MAGIQRALAEIRVGRVRATKWTLMLAPLLWTPMLVVALRGFLGVDMYAAFDGAGLFLAGNLLFGLAFLGAAVWASRRFSERLHRVPFVRRLLRDLGGRSLGEAERVAAWSDSRGSATRTWAARTPAPDSKVSRPRRRAELARDPPLKHQAARLQTGIPGERGSAAEVEASSEFAGSRLVHA